MEKSFRYIEVKADTPFERGFQYGKQAADLIACGVRNYRDYFAGKGWTWQDTSEAAMRFVPDIEACMPEVLEEARGIAAGAGRTLEEIMLMNTRYELTFYPDKPQECTTGAVLSEASADHCAYMIKNWDYKPGILENIVVLHIEDSSGLKILGVTEAGQMIREGFNNRGIGIVNNYIESIYDTIGAGIPVCFIRRRILSLSSFDEAYAFLTTVRRSVSNNTLLVSAQNQAIDIEANPKGFDPIKPIGGIVTHANHFVVDPDKDRNTWEKSPKNRNIRLADLLYRRRGTIDIPYLQECLRDHEYYPYAICNHCNNGDMTTMNSVMTVASLIFNMTDQYVWICKGNPCLGTYTEYTL